MPAASDHIGIPGVGGRLENYPAQVAALTNVDGPDARPMTLLIMFVAFRSIVLPFNVSVLLPLSEMVKLCPMLPLSPAPGGMRKPQMLRRYMRTKRPILVFACRPTRIIPWP